MSMKIGVLVGRFQPFHKGHLKAVDFALKHVDLLYIAVGSAQKSHEPRNPFTAGERIKMIKMALDEAGVDCRKIIIVPVPDAVQHSVWVSYLDALVLDYDIVFSNEPLTTQLFKERGIKVVPVTLADREKYRGTEIRERMEAGKPWKHLVPQAVAKIIGEIDGADRMRNLPKS